MSDVVKHWISGKWASSIDGSTAESINPANGEALGVFCTGGQQEAEAAIAAARQTLQKTAWAHQPRLREKVLLDFANLLEANLNDLAELLTFENGKLLNESRQEVLTGISEARYYAGLARNIFGRVTELEPGLHSMLVREPLGVAGIIVPWNAPIALLIRSLAPAIAAGCTSVVKAAPQTALFNARIFELLAKVSDLPDGAVNMFVETGNDGAKHLVSSVDVDVISYTGSSEVGKQIMAAGSATLKRMNLELGGNAPLVILPDTDLEFAVNAISRVGTVMTGQFCCSAAHVLVHESRLDESLSRFKDRLQSIKVGPGINQESEMGPMIDAVGRERVISLVDQARASCEMILQGRALGGDLAAGSFLGPSLVRISNPDTPVYENEWFGPVLCIDSFVDEEEAVHKANNSRYGLAASVWSRDLQSALRVASQIQSGTVWINSHGQLFPEIETGGYKESGIGRLHGQEGLAEFMQTKHISWTTNQAS